MGGGIAAAVSNHFAPLKKYNLLGSIYIAPMFDIEKPNSCSLFFLRGVATCIPQVTIPSFIEEDKTDPKFETTHIKE